MEGFLELESESDSSDGNNTDNEQQNAQNQRYQPKVKKTIYEQRFCRGWLSNPNLNRLKT